jgi:hypothetical protein
VVRSEDGWSERLGPVLTPHDAAQLLGRTVQQVLTAQDLLRLDLPTGTGLPVFQFHEHDVLPGLGQVLTLLSGPMLPLTIASWLRTPQRPLAGSTPEAALRAGRTEAVCALAEQVAADWS